MNSISITLDVSKFNKSRINKRTFKKKDGTEESKQEYKVDLVALKEPKVITSGNGWVLKKTHFVVEQQTKDEKAAKAPSVYVGEGFQFFNDEPVKDEEVGASEDINTDDIPF